MESLSVEVRRIRARRDMVAAVVTTVVAAVEVLTAMVAALAVEVTVAAMVAVTVAGVGGSGCG